VIAGSPLASLAVIAITVFASDDLSPEKSAHLATAVISG
jgi:hypothetical protein